MRCILRDGWWFLCSGSLDTDGICISKVPALDTDDTGCLANIHWFVCLSPLGTEGAGRVLFLDMGDIGSLSNVQALGMVSMYF